MGGRYQKVSPLDGAGRKGVVELNLDTRNEHKEVRDVFTGEGQGLSDEDEYRINGVAMGLNEAHVLEAAVVSHIPVLEKLQHQLPAPIVRWDRFLPRRTLKVLLVENDDSTRQVVSALLRNCCYEVTAAANVLDAWRILQDLTNHIDLVLTEVVMPGWSGIGLLCKIMSHKTLKTIPVIMMSSNDSMGVVFKCLSKGAVDFLVKPIRKNELKNLWQHVWRRCHSSSGSGSGSESGIEGQKFTKSKSEDDSDNNSGSNDEGNKGSIGLSAREGSDNGSGTQSSRTKRAFEAESPPPIYPSEQLASPNNSTCAHVIHPKLEPFCSKKKEQNIITDDIMSTDLRNESYQTEKVSTKLTGPSTEKFLENSPSNFDVVRPMNYNTLNELSAQAPDQQSVFLRPPDTSKDFLKISENEDNGYAELPSLELSLKRLRSNSVSLNDERNVLKHSNLSAFSRYPAPAASVQSPTYRPNSALHNSSEPTPQNHLSNGSSTNTNINVASKPGTYKEASTSAFHPLRSQSSTIQPASQEKIDESAATAPAIEQSRGSKKQPQLDQDGFSVDDTKEYINFRSSSNAFTMPGEANCSLNGSNSGSNNGCSDAGGTNMDGIGVAEKSGGINGAYQNRFAQREAALNKFRQKRKERNFGKKVRYQSRKRLAEQRPRVRGQFVRRITCYENHEEEDS